MTATETLDMAVNQLSQGDQVHPAQAVLGNALSLAEALGESTGQAPQDAPLEPWSEQLENLLAVSLPTLVYGGDTGRQAVLSALRQLGREQAMNENDPATHAAAALALHDVVWAVAAFALASDRTDVLSDLARVQAISKYGRGGSVFEVPDLRHASAFDRSADSTYKHCLERLSGLSFRASLPQWRRDSDLEGSLAEAELLAALVFARRQPDRTYSVVVRTSRLPEMRLVARLESPGVRADLSRVFDIEPERLERLLEELYERLQGPNQFAGGRLFGEMP